MPERCVIIRALLSLLLLCPAGAKAVATDTVCSDTVAVQAAEVCRPWAAAAEVAAINVGILTFDRFVINEDFAHITMKTVKRNMGLSHWFWDNDKMYTNLLAHPYHGSLYYNAARSNGLGFGVSSLYSIAGSLMWEIAGESELLSVNDFLSTPIGGIALGETAQRLADVVIDDTKTGSERFLREAAAFVINPMRGINRLIHGESWKRRSSRSTLMPERISVDVYAGVRGLHTASTAHTDIRSAFVGLDVEYGNAVQQAADSRPYSYFLLSSQLAVGGRQPIVNRVSLVGRLVSCPFSVGKGGMEVGLYQHFNYLQTHKAKNGDVPYLTAETFSVGIGMQRATDEAKRLQLRGGIYANAMVLGGMMSDIRHDFMPRNYNMGSGFTLRCNTVCDFGCRMRVRLAAEYYRLYTWIDCTSIDFDKPAAEWGAQGDKGVSGMLVASGSVRLNMWKHLGIFMGGQYLNRHSHYKLYPALSPSHSHTLEWRMGLSVGL